MLYQPDKGAILENNISLPETLPLYDPVQSGKSLPQRTTAKTDVWGNWEGEN